MFRILLIIIFFSLSFIKTSKANFDVKARTAILLDYHSEEHIISNMIYGVEIQEAWHREAVYRGRAKTL